MDITAEVYQVATLLRFAMLLVNIILIMFALKQVPDIIRGAFELVDNLAKRRKIKRGHTRKKYEALQVEGGDKNG